MRANSIPLGGIAQYLAHNWPAGADEHMVDWIMLEALRSHPMRSIDPATPIHITGVLGVLSYFTNGNCKYKWVANTNENRGRMTARGIEAHQQA